MPKLLFARPPRDATEEGQVRKLAASRHAPGDWIRRAQMIAWSWAGWTTTRIAAALRCHPQTVRERLVRFNAEGVDGLGDLPGGGRKPRLTEAERSRVLALAATTPPGRLERGEDGVLEAADEDAARRVDAGHPDRGGPGGRHPHRAQPGAADLPRRAGPLAPDAHLDHQPRPGVRPKRTRIVALHTAPRRGRRSSTPTSWAR